MKTRGYVLVNVLILVGLLTATQVILYQHYSQQRQVYSSLQNELVCKTMVNLSDGASDAIFNTGTVNKSADNKVTARLHNNYEYISE